MRVSAERRVKGSITGADAHTTRPDNYQTITTKIVAAVEASPGDPVMPWQRGGFKAVLPARRLHRASAEVRPAAHGLMCLRRGSR